MDVSGEVADLLVKEGIQITEESIKLLAAGSKNLAAFLWALAKDNKKLSGKTNMARLLREGKKLEVFHIKEDDLKELRAYAKKGVLFAAVKDRRREDGMVDLITNVDYMSQVNLFLQRRGYDVPERGPEDETPKKAVPRAPQGSSSPERGSGSKPLQTRTGTTKLTSEKPSVKAQLDAFRMASKGLGAPGKSQQRTPPKTR